MTNKVAALTQRQRAEVERQRAAYQARQAAPRPAPRDEPIRLGQGVRSQATVLKSKRLGEGLKRAVRRQIRKSLKTPARRVAAGKIILRPIRLDGADEQE